MLKALFKVKDDELDFSRAIEIATETEDAAKVAKDTVYGARAKSVHKVTLRPSNKAMENKSKTGKSACYCCGVKTHQAPQCRFKDSECHFCQIKGHISKVCRRKILQLLKAQRRR